MTTKKWKEKRQFVRASFGWPAVLMSDQGRMIHGRVRDISNGGALIHIKTPLGVDDKIEVAIEISDFKEGVSATGIIVRVEILDEETTSPTYALGVRFTKMSSKGHKYFSGRLPSGWTKPVTDAKEPQESPDRVNQEGENSKNTSKFHPWVVGALAGAVLILIGIVFFQLVLQQPNIVQDDLHALSDSISEELQMAQEVSLQQTDSIFQIENRLARLEKSGISSEQVEKIVALLDSEIQRVQQITNTPPKMPEIRIEPSVKEVSAYHTVRPGETLFSISQQHGLAMHELLEYNGLSKGTVIFSNQKLRITPDSSISSLE